jgi:hypothetical protein
VTNPVLILHGAEQSPITLLTFHNEDILYPTIVKAKEKDGQTENVEKVVKPPTYKPNFPL